jgi:transposase
MPARLHTRDQAWLLPPHLEELIPPEHPVRFVAAFVDAVDAAGWQELGVVVDALGAPAYHPRLLLSVWCYGFMTGVRSSRRLEAACRESLPFLWLTGLQKPDHNTLWRFYQHHRDRMRLLLKRTVQTAVNAGLLDLALQAVDGSKIGANASTYRLYTAAGLRRLLERTDQAIADLEAQNQTGGEPVPAELPKELREKTALREKVKQALEEVSEAERLNLTDKDAKLLKVRGGYRLGYNAQAVASPVLPEAGSGQLITAAAVGGGRDEPELVPMLEAAEQNLGRRPQQSLADAGYHSAENLVRAEAAGHHMLMPDRVQKTLKNPYHKDRFRYDAEADTYFCPLDKPLPFQGVSRGRKGEPVHTYRAIAANCRACPAFGTCTTNHLHGRTLAIGPHDEALTRYRALMTTEVAQATYALRKQVIEPVFGVLKEQMSGRRFLLRGHQNVASEWSLLATAFNLRILARVWRLALP